MPEPKKEDLTPREAELQKQLDASKKQLQDEAQLREQVLADETIMAVLKAKKDGKEIEVVEKQPEEKPSLRREIQGEPDLKPSWGNLDQMSNSEMLNVLIPAVEELVNKTSSQTRKESEVLVGKRLDMIESNQGKLHKALIAQAAATGISTMRNTHPDFEDFSEDAFKVMEKTGLSLEDAYLLVKAKEGTRIPARENVETERPSSPIVSRPRKRESRRSEEDYPRRTSGTRSFRDIVGSALDKRFSEGRSH